MKLFKWWIELKIKRLDANQRCLYLANRLVEEVQRAGNDVTFEHPSIPEGHACIDVSCLRTKEESSELTISNITNPTKKWEIRGKLTAKIK